MVTSSVTATFFLSSRNPYTISHKKIPLLRTTTLLEISACIKLYNFILLIQPLQPVMFIFPLLILYVLIAVSTFKKKITLALPMLIKEQLKRER